MARRLPAACAVVFALLFSAALLMIPTLPGVADVASMWGPVLTAADVMVAVPVGLAAKDGRLPRWLGVLAAIFAAEQLVETITIVGAPGTFIAPGGVMFYTYPERLESVQEYRDVWRQWERESGFRVLDCRSSNRRVDVYGTSAVFTHDVLTTVENTDECSEPVQTVTSERETIVFARFDRRWLAVHEHLSGR